MQGLSESKKHLRTEQTGPEQKLWACLRGRRCFGLKFRRQVPVGPYVVDFLCFDLSLVVEVDGDEHAYRVKSDKRRTAFLESLGYQVIRFGNNDVMNNIYGVVDRICTIASETRIQFLSPHPPKALPWAPPSPVGRGVNTEHEKD